MHLDKHYFLLEDITWVDRLMWGRMCDGCVPTHARHDIEILWKSSNKVLLFNKSLENDGELDISFKY